MSQQYQQSQPSLYYKVLFCANDDAWAFTGAAVCANNDAWTFAGAAVCAS